MTRKLTALGILAGLLSAPAAFALEDPPAVDTKSIIRSDRTFTLQPHSEQTLRMEISGLRSGGNTLIPCWGFDVKGPAGSWSAGSLEVFGKVWAEDESAPDGGIPGAERRPDGTFAIPESAARLNGDHFRAGDNCRIVGWNFYGPDGTPAMHADGTAKFTGARATAARKASRRRAARRARGKLSQAGGVQVLLAGLESREDGAAIVVRVRTGDLPGPTTVTTHARVLPQRGR